MSNRRGDRNSTPSEQTLPKQQAVPGRAGQAHHQDENGEGEGADSEQEDVRVKRHATIVSFWCRVKYYQKKHK